jgi:hypothetical protein
MAKRKKKKQKPKRFTYSLRGSRKTKSARLPRFNLPRAGLLKLFAVICILSVTGLCLFFLDRYVKKVVPVAETKGLVELANPPDWVSLELKRRIINTACAGREGFRLNSDAARAVAKNLVSLAWLEGYQVQTTHEAIRIEAEYRRPMALIKNDTRKFYVDEKLVVLDYMPMPKLPIVLVKGVESLTVPPAGRPWQRDDLKAAVSLLSLLHKMDAMVASGEPLLSQIRAVDVSNFQGRREPREPHILLYAMDDTQIIWGAEPGSSQQYMEAREDEKLAMLYSFYEENGTLANRVKYIELRYPRKKVPQPLNSL